MPNPRPNDEERGQPSVSMRTSLARFSSSLSFALGVNIMGCLSITVLLAALAAAMMCGCRSPQNPSDEVRHASYIRCESLFTGNNEAAKRRTYIVFSGGGAI